MGIYNDENNLDKCIASVLKQTYPNWEFVICDDCSTDNSLSIIKKYQKKDNRIIVVENQQNLGLAGSLNNCLIHASGKYIALMDAADECLSNRIETQDNFLENNETIDCLGTAMIDCF